MKSYRLVSDVATDADIKAAFEWYESEQPGLGWEFLGEVRATYEYILDGPFKYQELQSGIRRALTRRFPYAIYYSVEETLFLSSQSSTPHAIPLNGSSAFDSIDTTLDWVIEILNPGRWAAGRIVLRVRSHSTAQY